MRSYSFNISWLYVTLPEIFSFSKLANNTVAFAINSGCSPLGSS